MADADARIMDMVRRELEKDRSAATEDLFDKAKKIDPGVAKLTARQFHAKYPLQVKRAMKGGGRRRGRKAGARKGAARKGAAGKRTRAPKKATSKRAGRKAAGKSAAPAKTGRRGRPRRSGPPAAVQGGGNGGHGDVRGLLLQFARQVAQADDKAEMVDVLASIDSWVDRVVAATSR